MRVCVCVGAVLSGLSQMSVCLSCVHVMVGDRVLGTVTSKRLLIVGLTSNCSPTSYVTKQCFIV